MSHDSPSRDEAVAKVRELVEGERTAMLTTIGEQGRIVSRPMATQDVEFDGDVWFFADRQSPKVAEIQADPRVNVTWTPDGSWVSLAGTAELVEDMDKKRELWDAGTKAWLQCEVDDPKVALIRVEGESAEYWDSPGGASTVLSILKGAVTGNRPEPGDNEQVRL